MKIETIDVFRFMDVTHLVTEHEGVQYLALKPLVDQIGLDWRNQKRAVLSEDGAILYGAKRISATQSQVQGVLAPPKEAVFVRLDRVLMYLARISTNQLKARGNHKAAEIILSLQLEWAQALHDYETKGLAVKAENLRIRDQRRKEYLALTTMVKAKNSTENIGERRALTAGIKGIASDLGIPVESDLFDEDTAA